MDKVQPIDAGFGNEIKKKIGENLERWLEKDDNIDKWHDKLSARERRILMTQWLGDAWDVLKSKSDYIWRLFQKTGCLITSDGSEDDQIKPQGLDNYSF